MVKKAFASITKDSGELTAIKDLMRQYNTYDQGVDVVSAFEAILTVPADMRATVAHFERYPKIQTPEGILTPDFTVLYTDNTLQVGEISRLSLRDESVDSACAQIQKYDGLRQAPDASGRLVDVTNVDVIQFVPMELGPDALDRIIKDRLLNPDHPYKPAKPPCIVQFSRDPDKYMFQRINDPSNGTLPGYGRDPNLGERIRQLNVRAGLFTAIKSAAKFMNDPIPPLYLAVILYMQTWPTQFQGQKGNMTVVPSETSQLLQAQYRAGSVNDVRRALGLLNSAGLAVENGDGSWTVAARPRTRDEHDLAQVIARKSATHATPVVRASRERPALASEQPTLFDRLD